MTYTIALLRAIRDNQRKAIAQAKALAKKTAVATCLLLALAPTAQARGYRSYRGTGSYRGAYGLNLGSMQSSYGFANVPFDGRFAGWHGMIEPSRVHLGNFMGAPGEFALPYTGGTNFTPRPGPQMIVNPFCK